MTAPKFTPGPWAVRPDYREEEGNDGVVGYDIVAAEEEIVGCEGIYVWPENAQANAHLIAAAPELYECLEAAIKIIGHPDDAMTKHFVGVLAKARGEG